MKSKVLFLLTAGIFLLSSQYSYAQKGVDDLVAQFEKLLHPPAGQEKNSLAYTQAFLDLKKKISILGVSAKAEFEAGISKFSSDPGYNDLHTLLFAENTSEGTADTLQIKNTSPGAAAKVVAVDSSVQMQVFDRKHKLMGTLYMKPSDIEDKMQKDGYQVSTANFDFDKHNVVLVLSKGDGSGTTAKVTIASTGDVDSKYKLQSGSSLTVHSAAGGSPSVKVSTASKKK